MCLFPLSMASVDLISTKSNRVYTANSQAIQIAIVLFVWGAMGAILWNDENKN